MLGQAKPFASLSSGLLARKGQAKPAMRPQGFNNFGANAGPNAGSLDDLGWNDMGEPASAPPAVIIPVAPNVEVAPAPPPPVLVAREALKDVVEAPVVATVPAVSHAAALRIVAEGARSGKAAFTLRLDHERHLRLRLASAVAGRSSQQIVTQALDAFLNAQPEVEELARQLDRAAR